ncbi:hypothetical protein NDU88_003944 [Pleurodeles waltl]|uniref:Uncharacterized protein n=1 Tax=Pleurodeles waltl TaxID=8319 RepID=A0AAV7LTC0_PLEWA|nr:hypothetical protein NDU88_003944 [Pleurodeles waltl]
MPSRSSERSVSHSVLPPDSARCFRCAPVAERLPVLADGSLLRLTASITRRWQNAYRSSRTAPFFVLQPLAFRVHGRQRVTAPQRSVENVCLQPGIDLAPSDEAGSVAAGKGESRWRPGRTSRALVAERPFGVGQVSLNHGIHPRKNRSQLYEGSGSDVEKARVEILTGIPLGQRGDLIHL